jgi:hypothetical protein
VLRTLGGHVLRPAVIMAVVDGVLEQLAPTTRAQDLDHCRAELDKIDRAVANLGRAIADAGALGPLLEQLRSARVRRDELTATISDLEGIESPAI